MKKFFLTLFCLMPILLYAEQADSTMQEIQGKATLADTDVLIVADSDTVYWVITYAQFKTLLNAIYALSGHNHTGTYEPAGITESDISDLQAYLLDADIQLFVDSVYRSGSDIIFVQRDGSTFTIPDSTAAAGSGISNIVEDTTPQLGGNLDIQAYNIEGVDATEFGYVDGVTSDIQGQFNALPATWQGDIGDSLDAYYIGVTSRGTIIWGESADSGWVEITIEQFIDSLVTQYALEDSLETPLEAILDLQDLQGAVTDAQVPNDITITALSNFADTLSYSWGVMDTTTTGALPGWKVPHNITIVEISAYTDANTCTFNLEERAETTPNTAGTDVMAADLVADNDQQEQTSFSNAAIDINDWLVPTISATGDVEIFSITVRYVKTN